MPSRARLAGALAGVTLILCALPAAASPEQVRVQVAPQRLRDAILNLALQSGVSLGGDLDACDGMGRMVSGRMTRREAFARLLDGTACAFDFPAPRTVLIRRRPPPARSTQTAQTPVPPVAPLASAPPAQLAEIVITAAKRADTPGRAPYAVTAVGGDSLASTRTDDLTSLPSLVAGMTVTNLGPGRDKVHLRGLSDGAFTGMTQSTVGLYVDEVSVTYNAPDPDLRLADIDRVEVVRGPQGALFGAGSLGGVVRVVTRKPNLDAWSGYAAVTHSITEWGGPNNALEMALNAPLLPGRLGARLTLWRERDSGYIDNPGLGLQDANRGRRDGLRLALALALNPDWRVTGGLIHQSINTADSQYGNVGAIRFRRSSLVREPHDNDFDETYVSLDGQGGWGHLVGSVARLKHSLDSRYDASPALSEFGAAPGVGAFDDGRHIRMVVGEITFTSAHHGRVSGVAGVFLSDSESEGTSRLTYQSAPGAPLYGEARSDKMHEGALYGEATYDLTDQLFLTLGLRWFNFQVATRSRVSQAAGQRDFTGASIDQGLSPTLLLRYQPAAALTLYAQAAQGYRAGGWNSGGVIGQPFNGGLGQPAHRFNGDELWNYEIGAKASLWDGRLQVRSALFLARWDGIQTDQFLPSGLPYTVNVGDGANVGFEVETLWRPAAALEIRLAGLIDDPQLTRRNPAFASARDSGLPGVPGASASGGITYRHAIGPGLTLTLDAQVNYVGVSYLTFDALSEYRMGDYATGKVSAAVGGEGWRLTGFVDNPGNTRTNTFSFGNPFHIGRINDVTPLRPRTAGLELTLAF